MRFVTVLIAIVGWQSAIGAEYEQTELRMPGIKPEAGEQYLCRVIPLDQAKPHYLVGYKPHASMHTAHHMLLFGCEEPGMPAELDRVWNCGEMQMTEESAFPMAPTCARGSHILYAWARDAPNLNLPEGVGFKVGGDSAIQYLVLQVHYMHKMSEPDFSGVTLISTAQPLGKTAATMLMATNGKIAAHTKEHFETACAIDEDVEMHPFAFRVHAHKRGKVVSGWKVTEDDNGKDRWELIGKKDPMKPEMFYPVQDDKMVLKKGDVVAARCTMENDEDHDIRIGSTGADEMCNFYMMYWVEGDNVLQDNTCLSPGPPEYYWAREAGLNNIPEKAADTL